MAKVSQDEENRLKKAKNDKISAEVRRGYRDLSIEFSQQNEAELKPLKLIDFLQKSDKLYKKVIEVQEAVYDARIVNKMVRICKDKTNKMSANAIQFHSHEYADRLVRKMKGVQDGGRVKVSRKRLTLLGKEVKSLFNRSPVLVYLNGALGFNPPEVKERKRREPSKLKPTKMSDLKSTQANVVEQTENSGNQTEQLVVHTLRALVVIYKNSQKKSLNYFRFVLDPVSFGKTVENMFHVSFLVKEGKARIFLENGIPLIKPVKPKKSGSLASADDGNSNQVVMKVSMYEWERLVDALSLTESMIPPVGQEIQLLPKQR